MQDISSLTRDQTCAPLHWEFGVLTTRPLGESLFGGFFPAEPRGSSIAIIHYIAVYTSVSIYV